MCAARVCVEHAYDIHTIITVQSRTHQYSILNNQYVVLNIQYLLPAREFGEL